MIKLSDYKYTLKIILKNPCLNNSPKQPSGLHSGINGSALMVALLFNMVFLLLAIGAHTVVMNTFKTQHYFRDHWKDFLQEEEALLNSEKNDTIKENSEIFEKGPCLFEGQRSTIYLCCKKNKTFSAYYLLPTKDRECKNVKKQSTPLILGYLSWQNVPPGIANKAKGQYNKTRYSDLRFFPKKSNDTVRDYENQYTHQTTSPLSAR